ncbi:MAG TPA: N-acetyltransferase [Bacteroidetes bacterium]|nr:N-acetyltransferase [Bacteroidota bacterium]
MDFSLRPWSMNDLDNLVKYANNFNIAKNLTNLFPYPYKEENGKQFIGMATEPELPNVLAIDINGEAVGSIGVHPQKDIMCKNAEMGYWLAEPFWGKGIMTRAVVQMVEYGFKHWDINRIYARPFGTNTASQKVLEKAGFMLEHRFEKTVFKNGEYLDELYYAVRRQSVFGNNLPQKSF